MKKKYRIKGDFSFSYKGKKNNYIDYRDSKTTTLHNVRYHWEEGNYSCDCNRSNFLDIDDEMECGEEIKLDSYVISYIDPPKEGVSSIWMQHAEKDMPTFGHKKGDKLEGSFGNLICTID